MAISFLLGNGGLRETYLEERVEEYLGGFCFLSKPLGLPLQECWSARSIQEARGLGRLSSCLPGRMAPILGRVPIFATGCLPERAVLFASVAAEAECLEAWLLASCLSPEDFLGGDAAAPVDSSGTGGAAGAGFCSDDKSLGDTGGL